MKTINYKALEGKTVGEIITIENQVKKLPVGFKLQYSKPKVQSAEELLKELLK